MKRPTIKDVAKIAGVTHPTVSRVMSNKPYVSPETRERVQRAIEELGYRPSAAARSMVSNRTHALAMLVPHLSDPNFGVMVAGAERAARGAGYTVLVAGHEAVSGEPDFLAEHRVDGLVLVEPQRFRTRLEAGPPLPTVAMDDVPMDNRGGARALAEHLRGLGHHRVVLLGGPADSPYAIERLSGLREVYPDAPWCPGDWTAESGFARLPAALETGASAVLAANDFVALGALHALQARGLRVPADLSVTGFDDIPLARHFLPPLTTVRQSLEAQGARAVELLVARLSGEARSTAAPYPLELIVRDSTGPLSG